MNLQSLIQKKLENTGPVRVGLIGAGKFGSMYKPCYQIGLDIAASNSEMTIGRKNFQIELVDWFTLPEWWR